METIRSPEWSSQEWDPRPGEGWRDLSPPFHSLRTLPKGIICEPKADLDSVCLDLRPLASRTMMRTLAFPTSHPICGTLVQPLKLTASETSSEVLLPATPSSHITLWKYRPQNGSPDQPLVPRQAHSYLQWHAILAGQQKE